MVARCPLMSRKRKLKQKRGMSGSAKRYILNHTDTDNPPFTQRDHHPGRASLHAAGSPPRARIICVCASISSSASADSGSGSGCGPPISSSAATSAHTGRGRVVFFALNAVVMTKAFALAVLRHPVVGTAHELAELADILA